MSNLPAIVDTTSTVVFNPWKLEDPGYREDNFYTKSTDNRGHSGSIRVPVPTTLAAEIEALVASRMIPDYRTPQDVLRDAMVHRLHWLSEALKNGRLKRVVSVHARLAERQRQIQEMQELQELLNQTEDACSKAVAQRDWRLLAEILNDSEDELDLLHEPYFTRMKDLIDRFTRDLPKEWGRDD